jgi:hypothetical protein
MKVYSCPDEVKWDEPDYKNYDSDREQKREAEHLEKLKAWLIEAGYNGKYTGEIVRFPRGDGYAQYMMADGKKSCLIHLPYGDAWDYPDVEFLPKKEIIKRINQWKGARAIFGASQ